MTGSGKQFHFILFTVILTSVTNTVQSRVMQEQYMTMKVCTSQADTTVSSTSAIECAAQCSTVNDCVACTYQQPGVCKLVSNTSAAVTVGGCTSSVKISKIADAVTASACNQSLQLFSGDFVVVQANATWRSLSDILCWQWCQQEVSPGSAQFTQLSAATARPDLTTSGRCAPLTVSEYFGEGGGGGSGVSWIPLAVSQVRWRQKFVEENLCTRPINANVAQLVNATWAQPLLLDVCALACIWRRACEFFIFNSSGCYEGSLSLYMNSRLAGVMGCSIRHKLRSWANSTVAYYTFNSSWLNLANPAVMPAVNNSEADVNQDGFLVPLSSGKFVRINLAAGFGLDAHIRANKPITFALAYTRLTKFSRTELLLLSSCTDTTDYNGSVNEVSTYDDAWYLNSLTGRWPEYMTNGSGTYDLPNGPIIRLAVASTGTSVGYFVINGNQVGVVFKNDVSTYGSNPASIACLYLGYFPTETHTYSNRLHGRIQTLGIFTKLLTPDEIAGIL